MTNALAQQPPSFELENFEGPLEFLLYLVQQGEISISDIFVRQIVDQYLKILGEAARQDVDQGGEFVNTASLLLFLKSRRLLPRQPKDQDEEDKIEDPRFEVIHQLLDYCRFRDVAKELARREEGDENLFPRGTDPNPPTPEPRLGIEHVSLEELSRCFAQVLEQSVHREGEIKGEEWRVTDKLSFLREELKAGNSPAFHQLFTPKKSRQELIVTFLAILELMKLQEIALVREEGQIRLQGKTPEPEESPA